MQTAMSNKKITVKHYLNKRAKPKIYRKEEFYPLYIQLIVDDSIQPVTHNGVIVGNENSN